MIWHSSETNDVLSELGVTKENGLANSLALERLEIYGKNTRSTSKKTSLLTRFLSQINSKIVYFLTAIAIACFIVNIIYDKSDFTWV